MSGKKVNTKINIKKAVRSITAARRQNFAFFFSLVILSGLFLLDINRQILNIGIIGLALTGFWQKDIGKKLLSFPGFNPFFVFSLIYILHLAWYPSTSIENIDEYWRILSTKLPLIVLPVAFFLLPKFKEKQYHLIFYLFFIILSITAISAFTNYLINFEVINKSYLRSKIMPLPINHVRYSLMLAFGIAIGVYFIYKKRYFYKRSEYWVNIALTLFLIIFLHISSIRSGLGAFYILLGIGIIVFMVKSKRIIIGITVLILTITIPVVSFFYVPTFRNKIINTVRDLQMIERHSSANHYSLSARYYSYKVSWELVQENKLTGVGIANLNREVRKQYIRNYEVIHKKMQKLPHNQFLWYLAAFGVIGFSIFMVAFYYPLFYRLNFKKDYFFFVQYVIVSLSFLIEGTLETQLGVTYSIFFILLPLNQIDKTKEAK